MADLTGGDIENLLAREEIRHVLMKYCRGVDRRIWDDVADCYHSDAIDDHGTFRGRLPELMEWFRSRHKTVATSIHFIGNILIEVDGAKGVAETYFQHVRRVPVSEVGAENVTHVCRDGRCDADVADVVMFGRYLDNFERRDGLGWRIANRLVVGDTRSMTCPASDYPLASGWPIGRRDAEDRSVAFFQHWRESTDGDRSKVGVES